MSLPWVGTETSSDFVLFGCHYLSDFFDWAEQVDGNVVVELLEQAFAFECQQLVFSSSQEKSDDFVVDVDVDLEKFTEENFSEVWFTLNWLAFAVDDGAEVNHLLEHLDVCLHSAELCQGSRFGSETEKISQNLCSKSDVMRYSLSVVFRFQPLHWTSRAGIV